MSEHNPPAFPSGDKAAFPTATFEAGMTLRDWFAGQVLGGFCSQHDSTGMWSWMPHDAVDEAYRLADAMLKARSSSAIHDEDMSK